MASLKSGGLPAEGSLVDPVGKLHPVDDIGKLLKAA